MTRKLFAIALFAVACAATMYASNADAIDEAPAPRPVAGGGDDKKPDAKGKFGGFGGFNKGGKIDAEKLKELKEKFGKGGFGGKGFDPEKLKDLKGKFDPEKLKELKGKFGGFGKKKGGDKEEE